ncbi:MAG: hypothetical protein ABII74_10190 [Elusimicrobiota bacterium]
MNPLAAEIKKSLTTIDVEQTGWITAEFVFSTEFAGFKGHFPNNPILPGVCLIQSVILVCREGKKRDFRLKEIIGAKFFTPVMPGEEIICRCQDISQEESSTMIKAWFNKAETKVAVIQLKLES